MELFRPAYFIDPDTGRRVGKTFPGAKRERSPFWWCRYYDGNGARHKVKLFKDKKASQVQAGELVKQAERLNAGMVDATIEHAKRPLAEHAEDFRRYLAAKRNTGDYVALTFARLNAILAGCGFVKIGDIQPSAVVEFLDRLRRDGKSIKTANDYLSAGKGFTRWLWRDQRAAVDALVGLAKIGNAATDIRHPRRDLSPDELALLLEAARQSPKAIRCLAGTDRYFLYLVGAATGFRASELASMTPESFDLDGEAPTARVQASCTKNRKEATQPLPMAVAMALRGYLSGKPAGQPVWPGQWRRKAVFMVRADLSEARRTWLSGVQVAQQRAQMEQSDFLTYRDREGRYCDFHSLRHGYCTMLGKLGLSAKEHQDLARHSTYSLTARYTHSRFYDLSAAVQGLPIPTRKPDSAESLAATGTEGPRAKAGQNSLGPSLGPQPAISGYFERQAETMDMAPSPTKNPGKHAVFQGFQGCDSGLSKVEAPGHRTRLTTHSTNLIATDLQSRRYDIYPDNSLFAVSSRSRIQSRIQRLPAGYTAPRVVASPPLHHDEPR